MQDTPRSKGLPIKYGQLALYDNRNIFLQKSYIKCGEKNSPRPFSKTSKFSISLDKQFEIS